MKKMRVFLFSLFLTGMAAMFTLTVTGLAMAACPDGITGYWKLDETSGSTFADFIGGNGAVVPEGANGPDPAAGILINGAQRFVAGDQDRLQVSASSAFNWTSNDDFSIELWIQTEGDIDPSGTMVAIARDEGNSQWWIGMNGDGLASVWVQDGSGARISGVGAGADISDGNPHHVVFTRDGINNINTFYVDDNAGVEIATTGGAGDFVNGFTSADAPLTLGHMNNDGSLGYYFDGYIDEVAVYNKVLTAAEISTNYASGTDYCGSSAASSAFAPYPNNITGLWHLDETGGSTYTDVIGGNNAVTADGDPGDPDPATGVMINGAQRFVAGSPDGLQVGASSAFNWTSNDDFSIELWIQTEGDTTPGSTMVAIARDEGSIQWWIGMNGDGLASVWVQDGSGARINGVGQGADISDGNPHHVVFTRDGVNNVNTFYVDNTAVDLPTTGGSGDFVNGFASADAPLTLGFLNNDGSLGYYFDGYIDEVAVYNKALTAEEIDDNYTAGSGGNSIETARPAPTANAGTEQTVSTGAEVTLDGTGSTPGYDDAQITGYQWTQTPEETVTLSDATAAQPTFTAPAEEGTLTFELTVTAADGQTSSAASVNVVVSAAAVTAPTADAGVDQSVTEGDTVTLDGRASTAGAGGTLTYAWTQTDTTGLAVTLSDATVAQPTFTAPEVDVNGAVLTFQLIVTEDGTSSAPATVNITVGDVTTNPDADAGADQEVEEGATVTLDGSASSAASADGTLTYAWTRTDNTGLEAPLSDAAIAQPTFTAPEVDAAGATLTFQLTVTDDGGLTATDTVDILINDVASSSDSDSDSSGDSSGDSGGDGGDGGGGGCFIDSMF